MPPQALEEIAPLPIPHDQRAEDHVLVWAVVLLMILGGILVWAMSPRAVMAAAAGLSLVFGLFTFMAGAGYVHSVWTKAIKRVYGRVSLRLAGPLPGEGGRLRAAFELPPHFLPTKVRVGLLNYGADVAKNGGVLRLERDAAGGGALHLELAIPAGLPAKEIGAPRWQLSLRLVVQKEEIDLLYVLALPEGGALQEPAAAPQAVPAALQAAPRTPAQPLPPDRSSLWVLVALNLLPAVGAGFFGLRVQELVMLYWLENLVIGLFHLWRIRVAALPGVKGVMQAAFIAHYGIFCMLHGVILATLFRPQGAGISLAGSVAEALNDVAGVLALLALVVVHGYGFVRDVQSRRMQVGDTLLALMLAPYRRILVLHLFVMVGGLMFAGAEGGAMATLFVLIKTGLDVWSHQRARAFVSS